MSLVPRPAAAPATPWRTILSTPRALVLYNPAEHSLSVLPQNQPPGGRTLPADDFGRTSDLGGEDGNAGRRRSAVPVSFALEGAAGVDADEMEGGRCHACGRPFHTPNSTYFPTHDDPQAQHARYFDLLSMANTPLPSGRASPTATSRIKRFFSPSAPGSEDGEDEDGLLLQQQEQAGERRRPSVTGGAHASSSSSSSSSTPDQNSGADGYYDRFFVEKQRLGMGAYGSVFLCEHVLDGQPLGLYAVKKVAVGKDRAYRRSVLREVEVLKGLRHENIITYHHAWIEKARFSSFGPYIDSLHILMQYAPLGSLEDYLAERSGAAAGDGGPDVKRSGQKVEDVKAAFRAARKGGGKRPAHGPQGERRGVRLMSKDEIDVVFGGIVRGLGYLHNHDLLHLDLKCSNVLLYLDESHGDLIPRPLISDFGTTRRVVYFPADGDGGRRTGNTGTLEYCAPENVRVHDGRGDVGKEGDHWALGLILHKLLFFRLPYSQVEDLEVLAGEILAYPGFTPTTAAFEALDRRGLPRFLLWILGSLLSRDTRKRMGCRMIEDILTFGIREEGHHHYPFDVKAHAQAQAQVYEPTDADHSLAPYVPALGRAPAADEEATVTSLEPTPSASFVDLLLAEGEEGEHEGRTTTSNPDAASPPSSPSAKGALRLLPSNRILLPPPTRAVAPAGRPLPHLLTAAPVDLQNAAVVLAKFVSVHALARGRPTLGAQLAILALALASRGSARTQAVGVGAHLLLLAALWAWSSSSST